MTRPARIVSVDPGEEHVGVCVFVDLGVDELGAPKGWECTHADEFDRPGAYRHVEHLLRLGVDVLVYETWQLYPDKVALLVGSKCETAECIGVLKWLADHYDDTQVVEQPAAIQTPTRSVLKARGMKSTALRTKAGPHAMSAELHGWHYLIRTGLI